MFSSDQGKLNAVLLNHHYSSYTLLEKLFLIPYAILDCIESLKSPIAVNFHAVTSI